MPPRSKLPTPLARLVDQSAPARALELWQELAQRRAQATQKRGARTRTWLSVAACFVVLLGSSLALSAGFRSVGGEERALLAADRSGLPARIEALARYRAVDLNDGSRITVAHGAQLDVLETSARTVSLALRTGRARFDVRPRGPRSWRIECGAFSVEVVGTKFVLERSATMVSVSVLQGAVLVRGERIPDGVQRLDAGQSLESTLPLDRAAAPPRPAASAAPAVPSLSPPAADAEPLLGAAVEPAAPAARPRRRAPLRSESGSVDALFRAADVARLRGHAREAVAPLTRILERHADDPRASLAGFALARLQLGSLGQPALAAENLRLSLSLGLPTALLEDAYAKLGEAYERAGNQAAACGAWGDYQRRFPRAEKAARALVACQVDPSR